MERMDTLVRTNPSGLLDVTLSSRVYRDVFSPDVIIACDVTIPNTDFYVREELHPYQTSSKDRSQSIFQFEFPIYLMAL